MRKSLSTAAKLAVLGALVAFGSVSVPTVSYAGGHGYNQSCHFKWTKWGPELICKKTGSRDLPDSYTPQSTGLFPDRCNGVLGWWEEPVDFANGETFCVAKSTADFYHNGIVVDGGSTATCTVKVKKHHHHHWKTVYESTSDGACRTHSHNPH